MMNRNTESIRINAIRERLIEKSRNGMTGVIAARAGVPQYVLDAWVRSPVDIPTREMLVKIQDAVSEPVVLASEPTHYILIANNCVYVKEANFFISQGGRNQAWGASWRPVVAESIDAARAIGQKLLDGVSSDATE